MRFFYLAVLLFLFGDLQSQTLGDFRSTGSSNWSNPTSWQRFNGTAWESSGVGANNPGTIPTENNNVFIQDTHLITIDNSIAVCKDLNMESVASKIIFSSATSVLNVKGNLILTNTNHNCFGSWANGGKIVFSGSGNQTFVNLSENTVFQNIEINKSAGIISTNSNFKFENIQLINGEFQVGASNQIQGNTASSKITINGGIWRQTNGANRIQVDSSGGTPIGSILINNGTMLLSTTSSAGAGINVSSVQVLNRGTLTIEDAGGLINISTSLFIDSSSTINHAGQFNIHPLTTISNGIANYNRNGNQNILPGSYKYLKISGSGIKSLIGLTTIMDNGVLEMSGGVNVPTLSLNGNDLSVSEVKTTIIYSANAPQIASINEWSSSNNFKSVVINNSTSVSMSGLIRTIKDTLKLNAGTLDIGTSGALNIDGAIVMNNGGHLTGTNTSDLSISGNDGFIFMLPTVDDISFRNINVSGNRVFKMNGINNLNLNGNLIISANSTFDNGGESQIINGGGTVTINGKFITRDVQGFTGINSSIPVIAPILNDGCTIEYALNGNQIINERDDYKNIIISGSGIKTPSNNFIANGNLIIKDSVVFNCISNNVGDINTNLIMTGGRFIIGTPGTQPACAGTYDLTGGVIEFAGSHSIRSKSYQNIEITGQDVVNSNGNITLNQNGVFRVKSGGVFSINDNTISGPTGNQTIIIDSGAIFKCGNNKGFHGFTSTLSDNSSIHSNIESLQLRDGSTICYTRNQTQNITNSNNLVYSNLIFSGFSKLAPNFLKVSGNVTFIELSTFIHNNGIIDFIGTKKQTITCDTLQQFYTFRNSNTNELRILSNLKILKYLELVDSSKIRLTKDVILACNINDTALIINSTNSTIDYAGGGFIEECSSGNRDYLNIPTNAPKIIPPSPNAAALDKYVLNPVNYSTGTPEISIPFWSWQRNQLSFNIGLSYHAGGHKVDEMASNTGLGWSLSGLSQINRTVRGLPDDMPIKGYLNRGEFLYYSTHSYDGDYVTVRTPYVFGSPNSNNASYCIQDFSGPSYSVIREIVNNNVDAEQDLFTYSIPGHSGRFVFSKNKNIVPLEFTSLKFNATFNPTTTKIISFTITDDKGIVYEFNFQTTQIVTYINSENTLQAADPIFTSSWSLTKQKDPLSDEFITYNYGSSGIQYETNFSESKNTMIDYFDEGSLKVFTQLMDDPNSIISYNKIITNDAFLSSVSLPDGTLVKLNYEHDRLDLNNGKALTGIEVINLSNEIVKKYALAYDYFPANISTFFNPTFFTNDNSKRLKLEKIEEISNDNITKKTTAFTYNSLNLNCRGSMNVDNWGYNVNVNRNNASYLPRIPLEQKEIDIISSAGAYLYQNEIGSADKSPDEEYGKASILEKITYPTGGFTTFEYESNKAFSPVNYYEIELITSKIRWEESNFGQLNDITFPSRNHQVMTFYFKANENIIPRPTSQPPYNCIDDQDIRFVKFTIISTNASFTPIVITNSYGNLNGGFSSMVNLPLGAEYKIKFEYIVNQCSFKYPFQVVAYAKYTTPLRDKLVGGLRIKKIILNDGHNNNLIKSYSYEGDDGHTSGTLDYIPEYKYHRFTVSDKFIYQPPGMLIGQVIVFFTLRGLSRTSNPTTVTNFFNGSPLIYKTVKETNVDGSFIIREYDPLISASTGGGEFYPKMPVQDFSNLSGLLISEKLYNSQNELKKKVIFNYDKIKFKLDDGPTRNLKFASVASCTYAAKNAYVGSFYYMYTTRAEQTYITTNRYENGLVYTEYESKSYSPTHYYLQSINGVNSKGERIQTDFYYPFQSGGVGTPYNSMVQKNNVSPIITTKVGKYENGIYKTLKTQKNNYTNISPGVDRLTSVSTSQYNNQLQNDFTIEKYDAFGNILQTRGKDGIVNTFIWGYKSQYPVAKIVGKTYEQIFSFISTNLQLINNPSSDIQLRDILNQLRSCENCYVTTYTYKPLVGITSETGPDGKTTYYEYDNFNRLTLVRDFQNNILKKICYNINGQITDCGFGTNPNWTYVSNTCEVNSLGIGTGFAKVVEIDLNPNSGTYNSTRTITIPYANCLCNGEGQKIVNGICEQGTKYCMGSVKNSGGPWQHYYKYIFSDNSLSENTYIGNGICDLQLEP